MAIEINTVQGLLDIKNDLSADYVLTDDIDLSGLSNWEPIFNHKAATAEDGFFKGTLDGQGHKIMNLSGQYIYEEDMWRAYFEKNNLEDFEKVKNDLKTGEFADDEHLSISLEMFFDMVVMGILGDNDTVSPFLSPDTVTLITDNNNNDYFLDDTIGERPTEAKIIFNSWPLQDEMEGYFGQFDAYGDSGITLETDAILTYFEHNYSRCEIIYTLPDDPAEDPQITNFSGNFAPNGTDSIVPPRSLFMGLLNAEIKNLILENVDIAGLDSSGPGMLGHPEVDFVSVLSHMSCNSTFKNIKITGRVAGRNYIAPLSSIVYKKNQDDKILIDNVVFDGDIFSMSNFAGLITNVIPVDQNVTLDVDDIEINESYVQGRFTILEQPAAV